MTHLEITGLRVEFPGPVVAVRDLSCSVARGRTLAIVGESGSGKSATGLAVLGLHDPRTTTVTGSIRVGGTEIVGMREGELTAYRGAGAAMIFQDPQSSLHPYFRVGAQIAEAYRAHHRVSRRAARTRAAAMLARVGITADGYPHEFSGGMRQRAMIAMALVNEPRLLIADEPTTALDVTVQAQILDLIAELRRDTGAAVVFVTHDLAVAADVADDVLVLYAGRVVETGPAAEVLAAPRHPYTQALVNSVPVAGRPLHPVPGSPPGPGHVPDGCAFHPRCEFRGRVPGDRCVTDDPPLLDGVRCHLHQGADHASARR